MNDYESFSGYDVNESFLEEELDAAGHDYSEVVRGFYGDDL